MLSLTLNWVFTSPQSCSACESVSNKFGVKTLFVVISRDVDFLNKGKLLVR